MKYLRIFFLPLLIITLLSFNHFPLSAQPSAYQYIYPLPNKNHVPPKTTIIIRFAEHSPKTMTNLREFITVSGSVHSNYPGDIKIASDEKTIIFTPEMPFAPGEKIKVKLNPMFSGHLPSSEYQYSFFTSKSELPKPVVFPDEGDEIPKKQPNLKSTSNTHEARVLSNGVSIPSDFPELDIPINNNPDPAYIFINYRNHPAYQLILQHNGEPVWYLRVHEDRRDFKAQPNGQLSMMIRDGYGGDGWGYIVLNDNYEYAKTIRATNGYSTDEHELFMLPDSGYFIIGRRDEQVDMSAYGKPSDATVRETCIQEYTKNDELIFQWAAWDHFDPADMDWEVDGNENYIRFPHMNAVYVDEDGHILLSSRHLSEVTKINRQTGEIIWRLSGNNNQFTFNNDDLQGFRNQHAVSSTGKNRVMVFDNGNSHDPSQSRSVEYELNQENMTATLVWEFRNDKPEKGFSHYMGNTQRLNNGNTLINWAIAPLPKLSEITPEGDKAYEMNFARNCDVYRTFKMNWQGKALRPYLMVESYSSYVDLIFNKFGDPDVDYYNIYAGKSPNPLTLLDTSRTTLKTMNTLENGTTYFRVTAVDKYGNESEYSNEESVFIFNVEPGENLVRNGDFADAKNEWIWQLYDQADADWIIEDGETHISISNGGQNIYSVQLRQNNIPLIRGRDYVLEFDARAATNRIVEIKVGQDVSPFINYSKITYTELSPQLKHYEYKFTMEDPSDNSARLVINSGTSDADVYIDNIVLKEDVEVGTDHLFNHSKDLTFHGNYPNPFVDQTTIEYNIPAASHVKLEIYTIEGKCVFSNNFGMQQKGTHTFSISTGRWGPGVYVCIIDARADHSVIFRKKAKMVLVNQMF